MIHPGAGARMTAEVPRLERDARAELRAEDEADVLRGPHDVLEVDRGDVQQHREAPRGLVRRDEQAAAEADGELVRGGAESPPPKARPPVAVEPVEEAIESAAAHVRADRPPIVD